MKELVPSALLWGLWGGVRCGTSWKTDTWGPSGWWQEEVRVLQGAHLQLRPAGGGSQHSCPLQCSRQSPPRGHQHPGAAARGTAKTGSWEKSHSEGHACKGPIWTAPLPFSISFMVVAVQLASPNSKGLCSQSRKPILAPCWAQEAGLPQGITRLVIPAGACVGRPGSCRDLSHRTCCH